MVGSLNVTFEVDDFAASSRRRFLEAPSSILEELSCSSNDRDFRLLKLVDSVWSSLSALLNRETEAEDVDVSSEEDGFTAGAN